MKDNSLENKLHVALEEVKRLRDENAALKKALALSSQPNHLGQKKPKTSGDSISQAAVNARRKIALFRSLFRGRDDVYAERWESRSGASGYSPVHYHASDSTRCRRTREACTKLGQRLYFPLTDEVMYRHLSGTSVIGIYPLRLDDRCYFLAIDFDNAGWEDDVAEYLEVCAKVSVPVYPERSRSGSGGHVWMFFRDSVPAVRARRLGAALVAAASMRRFEIAPDSFDRMFPNQDWMPKGGFGNLIALPLQKAARAHGNSVFLDRSLAPVEDQWEYLAGVRRITEDELETFLERIADDNVYAAPVPDADVALEAAQENNGSVGNNASMTMLGENLPRALPLRIRLDNMLFFKRDDLPPSVTRDLVRCASFSNPDYFRAQRLRLSVYGKPRVIVCADVSKEEVALPRGCLDEVKDRLHRRGMEVELEDRRFRGAPIDVGFLGELRERQVRAFHALKQYEIGVLSAPTAFGKTVVALALIAERGVNTLIVVHRSEIAEMWRERILAFLSSTADEIGRWRGTKKKLTGIIDIATFQSLVRRGEVHELVKEYGHVVVDECHHVPAFSFEQVMKRVRARYILGLTATPQRKDGHHPIIAMQCGAIRFKSTEKAEAQGRTFNQLVRPRETSFSLREDQLPIHKVYQQLLRDEARNRLIIDDVRRAYQTGRSILVLSERKEHLTLLAAILSEVNISSYLVHGTLKKKQNKDTIDTIRTLPAGEPFVLLATGRFIGEGFDEPRLDTLFLTLPISWKGTLQQYAGRLHRQYLGKREVIIYDYVDSGVPMLLRMYRKRLKGYRSIGYTMEQRTPQHLSNDQNRLK